jgi:Domain of unknown function (DUF222)/HNH endonuclease
MVGICERPVWSMSGVETLSALDCVQAEITRLQTYRLRLLAAADSTGLAAQVGARDTVDLVATRHCLDRAEVRRDLRLALALHKYPTVQAALTAAGASAEPAEQAADTSPSTDPAVGDTAPGDPATLTYPAPGDPAPGDPAPCDPALSAAPAPGDHALSADAAPGDPALSAAPGPSDPAPAADRVDSATAALPGEDPPTGGRLALHAAQAEAIVAALEKAPTATPVETLQVAEREMVTAARVLAPRELRRLGKQVRDRLDPDGPEPAEDRASEAETLWLERRGRGVVFGGFLAGENAELFETLVFAGAKPHRTVDGQRDPRGWGKRQADALTAILSAAAGTGAAVPGHGDIKPHVTVTVALADLTAGTGTGLLAHGATLSAGAIRRLACDANVIPLVLGGNSEPLDVGTEERFVNRALRRALNARDKGCVLCGAPAAMCDAHHLIHWVDGGKTCVTNLVLLCKAHHRAVHRGHWTITMHNGQPQITRPDWTIQGKNPMPPTRNKPVGACLNGHPASQHRPEEQCAAAATDRQPPPDPDP